MADQIERGKASKRATAQLDAQRKGLLRYDESGVPIIPGEAGYDQGFPIKYTRDGWGVTPGDKEYATATLKPLKKTFKLPNPVLKLLRRK